MAGLYDTRTRYGAPTIWLHWLAAAGMIALAITGYVFMSMSRGPERSAWLAWHNATGYLTLILAAAHVAWRAVNPFPDLSPGAAWENGLARTAHWLLLFFLLVLPLSGWFVVSTGRRPPMMFDWFAIPRMPGASREYHGLSEDIHAGLSHAFLAVFALHVLGGLKRQFINRDGTIARMLGCDDSRD
ncbi:MAG: cytochrome b561 [Alphaproteobacteria bacterium]|jgi:cytochrome b561